MFFELVSNLELFFVVFVITTVETVISSPDSFQRFQSFRAQIRRRFFMKIIILMCWSIWSVRNDVIFRGLRASSLHCLDIFKNFLATLVESQEKLLPCYRVMAGASCVISLIFFVSFFCFLSLVAWTCPCLPVFWFSVFLFLLYSAWFLFNKFSLGALGPSCSLKKKLWIDSSTRK